MSIGAVLDAAGRSRPSVDGRGEFQQHRQVVGQFVAGGGDAGRRYMSANASKAIPRFRVSPAV